MSFFVDALAATSLIGIWPRFIEPRLLKVTHLTWALPPHGHHLKGLKIVQLSDLHFHRNISPSFLKKIERQVRAINGDLILFTGDFLCYSQLEKPECLLAFLKKIVAPLGCYCIFGNHDYSQYVSLNTQGVYDLASPPNPLSGIIKGIKTLLMPIALGDTFSSQVQTIPPHPELCALLKETSFTFLDNQTVRLPIGLNLTGLGDLALGRCLPKKAFAGYDPLFPGIVLTHNPDSFPQLLSYPGEWIIAGHTHGEQIHIPWPQWGRALSKKLARLKHSEYTRGLFYIKNKNLYVNRGLGGHKPFRLCSPPEITVIEAVV